MPCTSIRPSPPPAYAGATYAVVSSTASGETGAVGKAAGARHERRRRVDEVADRLVVDQRHATAGAPLPQDF